VNKDIETKANSIFIADIDDVAAQNNDISKDRASDITDVELETCGTESEVDDCESNMEDIKKSRKPLKHKARIG
jgi:hypothetical protein